MRLSTAIIPQSYYYRTGPVKLKLYLAPIPTIPAYLQQIC